MLDAERALANAGARAGVIPAAEAAAIAAACSVDSFDWDALLREGRLTGNPAEPLVRALIAQVGEDTARWVHLGATSQDIMDTAAMLVARRSLDLVLADLTRVADACASLARSHRDTPMAGRTLLQQAVPTTFGLKSAGWLVGVLDARARLAQLRRDGLAAQLGGAAGTLAALGEHGVEIARLYAVELELGEPTLPWHTNRVRVAELGAALDIAAGVLAEDRSRRAASRPDGGCRSQRGRSRRRLLGDAAQAQRGRSDVDACLRAARTCSRLGADRRARSGARACRRRLAGGVGSALGRARDNRWRRSRAGRLAGEPRGRRGPDAHESRPQRRPDRHGAAGAAPHRTSRPDSSTRARAGRLAPRRRRPADRSPPRSPISTQV